MSESLRELIPETGDPENGQGRTAPHTPQRLQILSSGVRIVRLGPMDHGWLAEYRSILFHSAQDFVRRAHLPGTPEAVLEELAMSLTNPSRAVWLVLRPDYGLLGFALAEVSSSFGAPPAVIAMAVYLFPRRHTPKTIFPALVEAILVWGQSHGATIGYFQTRRTESKAWQRIHATPVATIYAVPMPQTASTPEGAA
jgi:hypothetical protein